MFLQQQGDLDAAQRLYREAMVLLETNREGFFRHFHLRAAILDNLGSTFLERGQLKQARQTFLQAWEETAADTGEGRRAKIRYRIGATLYAQGRLREAWTWLAPTMEFLRNKTESGRTYVDFEGDLLEVLVKVSRALGKTNTAVELLELRIRKGDQLIGFYKEEADRSMRLILAESERKHQDQVSRQQLELENQRAAATVTRFRLYFFIALGFLFLLIGGIFTYRRINRLQRARELERMRKRLLEVQLEENRLEEKKLNLALENKKKDLVDLSLSISVRQEMVREMLERLRGIQALSDEDRTASLRSLVRDLHQQLSDGEDTDLIHQNVEQVNSAFFQRLESRFPDLTKTEKTLCSLLRLGLSNKEIARVRKVSPGAVKVGKNRLRKKLGLASGADLGSFLSEI